MQLEIIPPFCIIDQQSKLMLIFSPHSVALSNVLPTSVHALNSLFTFKCAISRCYCCCECSFMVTVIARYGLFCTVSVSQGTCTIAEMLFILSLHLAI